MKTYIFLLALLCSFSLYAQPIIVPQEVLVQLRPDASVEGLVQDFQQYQGQATGLQVVKRLVPSMNIWQLRYSNDQIRHEHLVHSIWQDEKVELAQSNHQVEQRSNCAPDATNPNDPLYSDQWQYINTGAGIGVANADLDAELAWDITTGGTTPMGDTIVVAVLDDGINLNHPDFGDNLWRNHGEIPGNNIDDDNNGYVDDYLGWDSNDNDDDVGSGFAGGHGTPVAGIIGAQGNNGVGVTGISWDVKVMIIRNDFNTNEANVLSAYGYALEQRKRYNQTNGAEGAFVVATNASWGINNGQPSNAPLWCAFYDTLGHYGILNAGATANANFNIDVTGDLPTACPSDYMIAVTNLAANDQKVTQAGYGATTIDLGAYGEGTYTTSRTGYNSFGGTSGATPHVAGTIGLMYAAPCFNLAALAKSQPEQAALLVRQALLDGVTPNFSLQGITVTNGRLNMNGALQELLTACPTSSCFGPFSETVTNITGSSALLSWSTIPDVDTVQLEWQIQGGSWNSQIVTTDSFTLSGLQACSDYQVQIISICDGLLGDTSSLSFQTDGCCTSPTGLAVSNIQASAVTLSWDDLLAATSYDLRYRPSGSSTWTTINGILNTNYLVTGLDSCMAYEAQLQGQCSNGNPTGFSSSFVFNTVGCGACTELNYCNTEGDTQYEWIARVQLHNMDNISGNNGGYAFFDTLDIALRQDSSYQMILSPGFTGAYAEYFRIWVDWNQDGDFLDVNELWWDAGVTQSSLSSSLTVPTQTPIGFTRMRVSMNYQTAPSSCSTGLDGEAEDYCVEILPRLNTSTATAERPAPRIFPNPSSGSVFLELPTADNYDIELLDLTGRVLQRWSGQPQRLDLEELPSAWYLLRIQSEQGVWTEKLRVQP